MAIIVLSFFLFSNNALANTILTINNPPINYLDAFSNSSEHYQTFTGDVNLKNIVRVGGFCSTDSHNNGGVGTVKFKITDNNGNDLTGFFGNVLCSTAQMGTFIESDLTIPLKIISNNVYRLYILKSNLYNSYLGYTRYSTYSNGVGFGYFPYYVGDNDLGFRIYYNECGNNITNGGEFCDSNTQNCTASNGFPGSQTCNDLCTDYNNCNPLYTGTSTVVGIGGIMLNSSIQIALNNIKNYWGYFLILVILLFLINIFIRYVNNIF